MPQLREKQILKPGFCPPEVKLLTHTQATRSLTTEFVTVHTSTGSLHPKNGVGYVDIQAAVLATYLKTPPVPRVWQTQLITALKNAPFPLPGRFELSSKPAHLSHEQEFQSLTVNYHAANETEKQ